MIYNIVLISSVQQSEAIIHIYTHTFIVIFFSMMACHRMWNIVPWAISRTLLFIYPIYTSLHLLIPNSQSFLPLHPPVPLGNHRSREHWFLWGSQCCLYQTLDQNLYVWTGERWQHLEVRKLDSSCGFFLASLFVSILFICQILPALRAFQLS